MTEKRFYIEDEHIKDNLEAHNPFYVETYNEAKRFYELLNDLNQEVIDAEHYHTVVLENFKAISKDYNKLKEENKQLKSDNKEYIKGLDLAKATSQSWASDVRELREENCRLEKKNEELKQREETLLNEIEDFQELLTKLDNENERLKKENTDLRVELIRMVNNKCKW